MTATSVQTLFALGTLSPIGLHFNLSFKEKDNRNMYVLALEAKTGNTGMEWLDFARA